MPMRFRYVFLILWMAVSNAHAKTVFVRLDPPTDTAGYLARLLINEIPFPKDRSYVSLEDSKAAMLQILWVLHGRIHHVPPGYTTRQIANANAKTIVEVITAPKQCQGFFRNSQGRVAYSKHVEKRLDQLLKVANTGEKPGKFTELILFACDLARAYVKDGMRGADRFASIHTVANTPVTGRGYAWMTNKDYYNPGGNYVSIPDSCQGALGGNRFYTLRKIKK